MSDRTSVALVLGLIVAAGLVTFQKPAPTFGGILNTLTASTTIASITAIEEAYFQQKGKYVQVLPGNIITDPTTGSVTQIFGKDLPPGFWINSYTGPNGKGYVVSFEDATNWYDIGFGPEGAGKTVTIRKPISVASTTP